MRRLPHKLQPAARREGEKVTKGLGRYLSTREGGTGRITHTLGAWLQSKVQGGKSYSLPTGDCATAQHGRSQVRTSKGNGKEETRDDETEIAISPPPK